MVFNFFTYCVKEFGKIKARCAMWNRTMQFAPMGFLRGKRPPVLSVSATVRNGLAVVSHNSPHRSAFRDLYRLTPLYGQRQAYPNTASRNVQSASFSS
jgi:hypothetical protein